MFADLFHSILTASKKKFYCLRKMWGAFFYLMDSTATCVILNEIICIRLKMTNWCELTKPVTKSFLTCSPKFLIESKKLILVSFLRITYKIPNILCAIIHLFQKIDNWVNAISKSLSHFSQICQIIFGLLSGHI